MQLHLCSDWKVYRNHLHLCAHQKMYSVTVQQGMCVNRKMNSSCKYIAVWQQV